MSPRDRRGAVALIYLASFTLVAVGAASLAVGLFLARGTHAPILAVVASVGGLLLLGLGVLRSSSRGSSSR